ncbi:cytochrome oxidase subunit IV [Candidatus Marinamargulisbacteria bacterium SCGC AG-414-C22]|nr:cytochrome oxidase subunit IV [Candidatus Marinamargulisbacteria bacterium SCGC AG-414-C22]
MSENNNHDHEEHFIVPVKYYVGTFIALLILTILTVAVALVDLGSFNIVVALGIAFLKATLVIMFFMGLKWDEPFNRVIMIGSVAFFSLFIVILLLDVGYRSDVFENEDKLFDIKSNVKIVEEYSAHHGDDSHSNDSHHSENDSDHH